MPIIWFITGVLLIILVIFIILNFMNKTPERTDELKGDVEIYEFA
jgi:hypothetical protein